MGIGQWVYNIDKYTKKCCVFVYGIQAEGKGSNGALVKDYADSSLNGVIEVPVLFCCMVQTFLSVCGLIAGVKMALIRKHLLVNTVS